MVNTLGEAARLCSHQALFYRDDSSYLAGTVPFILDGLAKGESVNVVVPGPKLRLLDKVLGPMAAKAGFIDMSEVGRNPARLISVLHALRAAADAPLRVIGEPVWPERSGDEYAVCVQHEALVNAAFAPHRVWFLCPYDLSVLDPAIVADIEATHEELVDTAGVRSSSGYAPEEAYERYNVPLSAPLDAVVVPFDLGNLRETRHTAVDIAKKAGVVGHRLHDVTLAVGEVCANSVQHGGGSGLLAVWPHRDGVVCEVTDRGKLSDKLAGRRPATAYQHGGRGLLLVNQVADLVRTHLSSDGMTTQIYLRR